jgi:hypothetical protein
MKDHHKELQNTEDSDSDTLDEEHCNKHPLLRIDTGHETLRHRTQTRRKQHEQY